MSVFSKSEDRQWSVEKIIRLIKEILKKGYTDKIVLIGDGSANNLSAAKNLIKLLNFSSGEIVDLTGKTTLSESSYIIKNCTLFIGLDSGPSHLAYMLAPKSLVIFVTVDPKLRLPLLKNGNKIICPYPSPPPKKPLYNGLVPVSLKNTKKCLKNITFEKVFEDLNKLMS